MRTGLLAALATLTAPALAQPAIGDRSPELGIEELLNAPDGAEATLDALKGKFVVLEFWATWCGPCIGAIPHLNELRSEFSDRGVVFLSVTDEDRALVEEFQKAEPSIEGWIGLDTDRSLFDAYGVRAIPQTIILDANGRVAARTHPARLTSERLAAYLSGERDAPATPAVQADASDRVRALMSGPIMPGFDPLDEGAGRPLVQFVLRKSAAPEQGMSGSTGGTGVTLLAADAGQLVASLLRLPSYRIDTSAVPTGDNRYDLIVSGLTDDAALPMLLEALKLNQRWEERDVKGYRLVASGDPKNTTTIRRQMGHSMRSDGTSVLISSAAMPANALAAHVASRLNAPCEAAVEGDPWFRVELSTPRDATPEEIAASLEESFGLTLEPYETRIEVVVIEPAAD